MKKIILIIITTILWISSLWIITWVSYADVTLPWWDWWTPNWWWGGWDTPTPSDNWWEWEEWGGWESTCVKLNTDFPGVWTCVDANNASGAFSGMMGALMKLLVNITIAVAFIALIAAWVMMTTSWISQNTAWKWKELLKKVILGIVLLWMSWIILHAINPNFFKTWLTTQLIKKI